jgi:hypothetical protein
MFSLCFFLEETYEKWSQWLALFLFLQCLKDSLRLQVCIFLACGSNGDMLEDMSGTIFPLPNVPFGGLVRREP